MDLGVFLVLGTAKSMYVSCPKGRREKLFLTSLLGLSVQGFTQEVTWKGFVNSIYCALRPDDRSRLNIENLLSRQQP